MHAESISIVSVQNFVVNSTFLMSNCKASWGSLVSLLVLIKCSLHFSIILFSALLSKV